MKASQPVSDASGWLPDTHHTSKNALYARITCLVCGCLLEGKQKLYCSKSCAEKAFRQRRGPGHRHAEYVKRREREYYHDLCRCGNRKNKVSRVCLQCERGRLRRHRVAQQKYIARKRREQRFIQPINPLCPNLQPCETAVPHAHCECGWPIPPDATVCHICIAEQKRLEFKIWPREEAA